MRGKIKKDLRKYMSQGEMIRPPGREYLQIRCRRSTCRSFAMAPSRAAALARAMAMWATRSARATHNKARVRPARSQAGQIWIEVDITIEELAQILGEELQLPNIEPRGKKNIVAKRDKYSGIRRVGPNSLRHFKRTYREALRRQISSGEYNASNPIVVPIREDMRFRSWKETHLPNSNAVIIYMMDVSGSMGSGQKELVRIAAFWIGAWLRSQYKAIEIRYIVHDAAAKEVDQNTFYHIQGGGTEISSPTSCATS